ncbi:MAG: hypothetical protein V3V71_02450, partial [Roseateles sp.]
MMKELGLIPAPFVLLRKRRFADVLFGPPIQRSSVTLQRMTESSSRLALYACFGLAAATLIVALSTYRDYGATWDEGVQSLYGERV